MTRKTASDEIRTLSLIVLCLFLLTACSSAAQTSNPASDRAAIEELSRQFSAAYMRGDAVAQGAIYTPDAVILPGNSEMIVGREAIQRFWTLSPGQRVTQHKATPTDIRIDGNHAYDYGVYEVSGERDGKPYGPVLGKYVIVWRREPEGWRMHLDMWNLRPQPKP